MERRFSWGGEADSNGAYWRRNVPEAHVEAAQAVLDALPDLEGVEEVVAEPVYAGMETRPSGESIAAHYGGIAFRFRRGARFAGFVAQEPAEYPQAEGDAVDYLDVEARAVLSYFLEAEFGPDRDAGNEV